MKNTLMKTMIFPPICLLGMISFAFFPACGAQENLAQNNMEETPTLPEEIVEDLVTPEEVEPASVAVKEPEPQEDILRWVRVRDDKLYLKGEPSGKSRVFVGLARPMSPVPVYEEVEGDGCKKGKWLRVGPKSFPGYVCSRKTRESDPPAEVVEDPKDPTKRNGFTYAIVIKDSYLRSSPGGTELATTRPKDSYVTVTKEKLYKGEVWAKVKGGWLSKKVLRHASAKGISALRGEILPEDISLPWVFVVAKEAKVYANAGDTSEEIAVVKRYDRFPVLDVEELEDPKNPEKTRRWAKISSGWVEGNKLDWVFQEPRPEGIEVDQKWIFADIEQQTLVAYEGDRPVFMTIFSSGRAPHHTVTGRYNVHRIYRTHTMENAPGGTEESYYYVADIPFVVFFHKTFALHGTYWHDNFGATRSHGCVNLVPADAKWLYDWIEPQLPLGWWGMALEEEDAAKRGWTTVITRWGDRIVDAKDVMNTSASKVVQEMRELREKQASGELPDSQPTSIRTTDEVILPTDNATPASAPTTLPERILPPLILPEEESSTKPPSSAPSSSPTISSSRGDS